MAFLDIFRSKSVDLYAAATNEDLLQASLEISSPWADQSHLETLTFADAFGISPANLPVTRSTAMSCASVAKCRNLLSSTVGRLEMHAHRNGQILKSQPSLLNQIELGRPNFVTLAWIVDHLYFYGRVFMLIMDRDANGRARTVRFVPKSEEETDKNGQLIRAFGEPVRPIDVFRIDGHNEGILNFAQDTIREAKSIDVAAANAGENPVPSILLKQTAGDDLSQDEINTLLARWYSARTRKGGGVGFVNSSLNVETLGQHPEQLLIDARNASALNIARISGLPAWAVDASVAGSSLTYSNVESRNRELLDYGLMPYLTTIEEHFSMLLPAGQKARFNTDELLRADAAGRFTTYKTAIDAGIYTIAEVREIENLEPLPESPEPEVAP